VLRTRSRRDVHRGEYLSHMHHSRNQLKKLNLKLRTPLDRHMPLKRRLDLKLSWSLKDPILKMETTVRRALNIALVDRNAPAQSLREITMSGMMIMRR
jgi:hypothetical protein